MLTQALLFGLGLVGFGLAAGACGFLLGVAYKVHRDKRSMEAAKGWADGKHS